MKERIFNLFIYSNLDVISQIGVVFHEISGTDEEKLAFLKRRVNTDFGIAEKFPIPMNIVTKYQGAIRGSIDYNIFRDLSYKGEALTIFEDVFVMHRASENPLVVLTPVINGQVKIDGQETIKIAAKEFAGKIEIDKQDDWFLGYLDNEGLHIDQLINDDFFEAIRILYNHNQHVSAMKLLVICIDTISYLEFGDVSGSFQKWMKTYTKLQHLNITTSELWEFRNSLLHMTNLDSRKVKQNKEKRLMFYVSHPETDYLDENDEGKYFKFLDLLDCVAEGISEWTETYNEQNNKFEDFVARYDRIISDKRKTSIRYR
jgi:hypothetical protein